MPVCLLPLELLELSKDVKILRNRSQASKNPWCKLNDVLSICRVEDDLKLSARGPLSISGNLTPPL